MKRININNKKGIQLNQAFGAVLAVVLVAVLVIVAIFLFDILGETFPTTTTSVASETGGTIDQDRYRLAGATDCNYGNAAISTAKNATSGQTILSGNYTLSANGYVQNATNLEWEAVNFTYSYTSGGDSCDAAATMSTQFGTYPALVGLVGTIVFLGIVLAVLVGSFVFGGKRREI